MGAKVAHSTDRLRPSSFSDVISPSHTVSGDSVTDRMLYLSESFGGPWDIFLLLLQRSPEQRPRHEQPGWGQASKALTAEM